MGGVAEVRASAPAGPFCGVNPGAPIWGGSILFTDAMAVDIASSGCRSIRLNFRLDGNSSWTAAHLAKYDTIVRTARDRDLQILGLICYEAVPGTQAEWNENYNTSGINAFTTRFAENAWLLINRYKNDIKLFEIWNEPNCWSVDPSGHPLDAGGFYIWPRIYANLLAETYKKCLTAGGPSFFSSNGLSLAAGGLFAHDIGGSFSTARDYMSQVYSQTAVWNAFQTVAGRRYPWDYFGYHFYLNQGETVSTLELTNYFNDIRTLKNNRNDATPFLITEFSWPAPPNPVSLQAANLKSSYDWLRSQADIAGAYWYQWTDSDGGYGLVYSLGVHKPAYDEFAAQCRATSTLKASFAAAPVAGYAPLTVSFTDLSTGIIATRSWSFGDLQAGSDANPSHVYARPGSYVVSLTVTGPAGSDTMTRADLITVAPPLTFADLDNDTDVDSDDVLAFKACMTGFGVAGVPSGCDTGAGTNKADLDRDGDVDQSDFGLLQACLSGWAVRAAPGCTR